MSSDEVMAIAKQFAEQVKRRYTVDKVILFGSYAKGKAWSGSDIDICVVSPKFGKDAFQDESELIKIAMKVNHRISPVAYNPEDIQNYWSQLAHEITSHGIQIV